MVEKHAPPAHQTAGNAQRQQRNQTESLALLPMNAQTIIACTENAAPLQFIAEIIIAILKKHAPPAHQTAGSAHHQHIAETGTVTAARLARAALKIAGNAQRRPMAKPAQSGQTAQADIACTENAEAQTIIAGTAIATMLKIAQTAPETAAGRAKNQMEILAAKLQSAREDIACTEHAQVRQHAAETDIAREAKLAALAPKTADNAAAALERAIAKEITDIIIQGA